MKALSDKHREDRDQNVIVFGMPNELSVEECSEKFMKVTRTLDIELQLKEATRLGNANVDLGRPPVLYLV